MEPRAIRVDLYDAARRRRILFFQGRAIGKQGEEAADGHRYQQEKHGRERDACDCAGNAVRAGQPAE
jgi:hypothetical protein